MGPGLRVAPTVVAAVVAAAAAGSLYNSLEASAVVVAMVVAMVVAVRPGPVSKAAVPAQEGGEAEVMMIPVAGQLDRFPRAPEAAAGTAQLPLMDLTLILIRTLRSLGH